LPTFQRKNLSIVVPVHSQTHGSRECLQSLVRKLSSIFYDREIEILLVPNPDPLYFDESLNPNQTNHSLRVLPADYFPGKGHAILRGLDQANYSQIMILDADCPFAKQNLVNLARHLDQGFDFVFANRRNPESLSTVKGRDVSLARKRHFGGIFLNRFARLAFPNTLARDTQCGLKGISRDFAKELLPVAKELGFFLDLEMFILAERFCFRVADIPVNISADNYSLSSVKIVRDGARALFAILKIWARSFFMGRYNYKGFPRQSEEAFPIIHADDWGLSPGVNEGILSLVKQSVLRRVSVMVNEPFVKLHLEELQRVQSSNPHVTLGLHFNLTHGTPLVLKKCFRSPQSFFLHWCWALVTNNQRFFSQIREELNAQIAAFKSLGIELVFFDSHQHVHFVPGFVHKMASLFAEQEIVRVRTEFSNKLFFTAKLPVKLLSLFSRSEIKRLGLRSRKVYCPHYTQFRTPQDFDNYLIDLPSYSSVLFHPAAKNDIRQHSTTDTYTQERVHEFELLQNWAQSKNSRNYAKQPQVNLPPKETVNSTTSENLTKID
jgi:predicted glycoside hydrolase/deacetylase ChbG (UPF0249 family)